MNPAIKSATSMFNVEVFKRWDPNTNVGLEKISESSTFFLPLEVFDISGGQITEFSMTTSSNYLGAVEGNVLTIVFTPATNMSINKGAVEIDSPSISESIIYNHTLEQSVIYFPNSAVTECTSPSFTTTDHLSESADNCLHIEYTGLLTPDNEQITITCTNWRNPLVPGLQEGYLFKTLDSSDYVIDEAESRTFDGTALLPLPIEIEDITYSSYFGIQGDFYGGSIKFSTTLDI
jgi:hypothetical protein